MATRVAGIFHVTIPVSTKQELLVPEERTLAILRWIQQAIPVASRWFPVFQRYVSQIAGRVDGFGGNSTLIGASGTGQLPVAALPTLQGAEVTGKIKSLIYDHFGDFVGFVIEIAFGRSGRSKAGNRRSNLWSAAHWLIGTW